MKHISTQREKPERIEPADKETTALCLKQTFEKPLFTRKIDYNRNEISITLRNMFRQIEYIRKNWFISNICVCAYAVQQ